MGAEENVQLVNRQLNDILSQIERILSGTDDFETIENFANYSEELKAYLRKHSTNSMILERVEQIPVIDLQAGKSFLGFLLVSSLAERYREYAIRKKALQDIKQAQGLYSSIQFLYKNENF